MKLTVLIHNPSDPDNPIGLIASELEHLIRILTFQTEEKGMTVEGMIMIKPKEEDEKL
jgi:hypothetical protein